jgi:hypothetical protein
VPELVVDPPACRTLNIYADVRLKAAFRLFHDFLGMMITDSVHNQHDHGAVSKNQLRTRRSNRSVALLKFRRVQRHGEMLSSGMVARQSQHDGLSRRGAPDLPLATRLTANVRGSTMSMGVGVKVCLNSPELQ